MWRLNSHKLNFIAQQYHHKAKATTKIHFVPFNESYNTPSPIVDLRMQFTCILRNNKQVIFPSQIYDIHRARRITSTTQSSVINTTHFSQDTSGGKICFSLNRTLALPAYWSTDDGKKNRRCFRFNGLLSHTYLPARMQITVRHPLKSIAPPPF